MKNRAALDLRVVSDTGVVGSRITACAKPIRRHMAHEYGPGQAITEA